ncbi:MAG: DNA methyltransferase [Candidatus Staskawiczbacteria bacterium RIFOXYD1_FULL_32_13]|uniref:site-specific DNA-methyltransferase (adenine-specific) n=2 Tax=Parcubacteria group TaxID=1794811 RepID=A0A1F8DX89_9BACT|nr:MAG: DNA methyltransferase [Candidatus Wolfebacteria bacterium RIFOXYB1_FULL_54_12]OGZ89813.1 MAG: DNA methyltransferase [Candidatus Staskawiczbacteria bacterium RIFOXYD1_FULL_32_13]
MAFYSPLRYPGGKNKLAKFVTLVCETNNISGHYVEPYAGGAGVALFLLLEGHVSKITINDFDLSIYAFWYAILEHTDEFCDLIEKTEVSVKNWKKLKQVQRNKKDASLLDLGFSTFFLNRTNRSGILDGGIIGGLYQKGYYKMDCRFNKTSLIERIRKIAAHKEKINLRHLDALELIKEIQKVSKNSSTIFYFDPPYYLKGESLYMNAYEYGDHEAVSNAIKKIKNINWIVSYDNVSEINNLYSGCKKIEYSFFHTAREAKIGKEVLFFSRGLKVPNILEPTKVQL